MKLVTLQDPIYGHQLNVHLSTWNEFVAWSKKLYGPLCELEPDRTGDKNLAASGYFKNIFRAPSEIGSAEPTMNLDIFLHKNLDKKAIPCVLAHELIHAGLQVMKMAGIELEGGEEALTYWHTWAMRSTLMELGKS